MKTHLLLISLAVTVAINLQAQTFHPMFACFENAFAVRHKDSLDYQYNLVSKLGFDGMLLNLNLTKLDEKRILLEKYNLQPFMLNMIVNLDNEQPYDTIINETIQNLKNKGAILWVIIRSKKFALSDPAGDDISVPIIQELADYANNYGIKIALYNHRNNWMEKFGDCIRISQKVNRPNVGVVFNLSHYLMIEDRSLLEKRLIENIPYLFAVSISGADDVNAVSMNSSRPILPLGEGSFDVLKLLRILKENNYNNPVALQCGGIPGDPAVYLKKSIETWNKYMKELSKD